MKILGIDYGRAKMGLAISETGLAEPWKVVKVGSVEDALGKLVHIVEQERIGQAVIGTSEGEMGEEQKQFAQKLADKLEIPVETWDETLSTQEAQRRSIEAGIPRNKRRQLGDAFAATVMLQSYLDEHATKIEDTPSV